MIRIPTHREPTHPGEMLLEEFLVPMGISQEELSKGIHVPSHQINEIINKRSEITPGIALRLAKFFGVSEDFWMNLQLRWDLYKAKRTELKELNTKMSDIEREDNMSIKRSQIFVVHGRNESAKNAMFTFLRAISLQPLEWEQAVKLTGKTTPTTLEIVKAGIGASQCVIVLLTGDDLAKLRPVYGKEDLSPQPRPNVIFEAGLALGNADQLRTILVCFEKLRGFSDIDGLNYIFLDNSPEARKKLLERLKNANCELDDSGADYLSKERGGNFNIETVNESFDRELHSDLLDRGRFTEFIADSTLSLTLSNIELNKKLDSDIKSFTRLDLKYHYIGAKCASYWLNLCQHPEYNHAGLKQIIKNFIFEIICAINNERSSLSDVIDLISLGPGDGDIDALILYHLEKGKLNIGYYYCIDISFELLQQAVGTIIKAIKAKWLKKPFCIKAIHGDFTNLDYLKPIYIFDKTDNLFSLTGYTFGNYNESQLIQSILSGMNDNDFLLLDARLHGLDSWDGKRLITEDERNIIIKAYSNEQNNQFAFGPVEIATALKSNDVKFGYEINRQITVIPMALNVITYCYDLPKNIETIDKKRLDLAATTLYSYGELKDWLLTRGLRLIWSKKEKNTAMFLLKKVKTKNDSAD